MSEQVVKRKSVRVRSPELARALKEAIAAGRYPVGTLMPTEFELCDLYGASRHTMRLAINELVESGLVSRRKRTGTRVEARTSSGSYRQALGSLDDLVQFGASRIRSVQGAGEVILDAAVAEALGCAAGSRWLRVSSLRRDGDADALPVGWTDVYLDPSYADVVAEARRSPGTLIVSLIAARHGRQVAEVRQEITAIALPRRVADGLQAEPGSPALRIIRHYVDDDGIVFEISDSIHPADRFTASSQMRRQGALQS